MGKKGKGKDPTKGMTEEEKNRISSTESSRGGASKSPNSSNRDAIFNG